MKKDEFHEEVEKIVHKKKKVKPNYKKRQRQEIDRMKRRKRREMIKSDISSANKKERAKRKTTPKRNGCMASIEGSRIFLKLQITLKVLLKKHYPMERMPV